MKKIKVLHIITRLDRGGSAENALLTVNGLDKERYEVDLISGSLKEIKVDNINLTLVSELIREINLFEDILALFKLYNLIRKGKYDIVHTHSSKAGILGRVAAKMARVSLIVHTPHGHVFYGYYGKFKTFLFILLERFAALFTDKIITLTELGKKEHIKFKIAGKEKFVPVYSGVELNKFLNIDIDKEKEREKLGLSLEDWVVGSVARLVPIKGHKYLLEAAKEVIRGQRTEDRGQRTEDRGQKTEDRRQRAEDRGQRTEGHQKPENKGYTMQDTRYMINAKTEITATQQHISTTDRQTNIKFLIVGDGPLREELEEQAKRLKIDKNVMFLGMREDIPEILSTFDLFVLPSLNEGMGRVLIEAMAAGLPVVATNVGGIPEVVEDKKTGLLAPPKDSKKLAEAIIELLKDPKRAKKMGGEGKKKVITTFGVDVMVKKIEDLYEELVVSKML